MTKENSEKTTTTDFGVLGFVEETDIEKFEVHAVIKYEKP